MSLNWVSYHNYFLISYLKIYEQYKDIVTAKADFLKEQQEELADDPKKFWRLIKTIEPGKKKGSNKISLSEKDEHGRETTVDDSMVADYINKFFSETGPKLAKEHKEPWRFYGGKGWCPLPTNVHGFWTSS